MKAGLHLHLDPTSGIAGDMTVAALVDAGVPRAVVASAIAELGVPGLKVRFETRKRGAFVGTGFDVSWPGARTRDRARPRGKARPFDEAPLVPLPARPRLALRGGGGGHHHGHPDHHHHPDHGPHHHPDHHHTHEHGHGHQHRDHAEIRRLLKRARLDPGTRDLALDVFARIAEVEGKLHGVPADAVAFHEVGAYDSIADIVGAAAAITHLAPADVTATPPVLGSGRVRTAHGIVAVPAPATAALLAGVPVSQDGEGELTTPTGAAILKAVVKRFTPPPPMEIVASGLGAGTRELADRPNVLRVLLGNPQGRPDVAAAPDVLLLETNIDDLVPQLVLPLMTALFDAGALDVWCTPILMKKGRPAYTISALAPTARRADVERAFFAHSTTLGVRVLPAARTTLERSFTEVATAYGNVRIKLASRAGEIVGATPEYDDCHKLAVRAGVPVRRVMIEATVAAGRSLPRKRGRGPSGR